ncbi:serine hydrolase [Pollutimonas subterranea]|uniref:serine hydrolase n=1 Tax=Pollutimonas subterranea TaxID=2045210 RepID=UPI00130449A2|nr:serine hydrolase [Pollutimonas subterranea]
MNRRTLLRLAALGTFSAAALPPALATSSDDPGLEQALKEFGSLSPGNSSASIVIDDGRTTIRHGVNANLPLFVGSAIKTFILAQYLKEVEAGRLSEDAQLEVGPDVWSPSSPVLINLQGTTTARSVLEAMITHSDNTATDIAINAIGPDKVRALIKTAGLHQTRIPDSTRILFSYLAGAPEGSDIGWAGIEKMMVGKLPGRPRAAINDHQTMVSTAAEMTDWYRHVLAGNYFEKPETLAEFKRISAMAGAIPQTVPPDVMGYGKGGSIDWDGFHCFSLAGQMVLPAQRVNFCFTINWNGDEASIPTTFSTYIQQCRQMLRMVAAKQLPTKVN